MNSKRGPIIFLITLTIILVFILGIRYGQRVEKTNKAINYFLSLPPTKPPEPTQKPLEFKEYTNKVCGIKFLYPTTFSSVKSASESAIFSELKKEQIEISCEKNSKMQEIFEDEDIASIQLTFKGNKITGKATNNNSVYILKLFNPINAKNIYVAISKTFFPLFEKSLEFIPRF